MVMKKNVLTLFVMVLLMTGCDTNQDMCTGVAVGVISVICRNVSEERVGYYIITNKDDSVLVFDSTIVPKEYNRGYGIHGIEYKIPYSFSFVRLDSLDKDFMIYYIPLQDCLDEDDFYYCPEDFKQARIVKIIR